MKHRRDFSSWPPRFRIPHPAIRIGIFSSVGLSGFTRRRASFTMPHSAVSVIFDGKNWLMKERTKEPRCMVIAGPNRAGTTHDNSRERPLLIERSL
jgi:hypothetical protein